MKYIVIFFLIISFNACKAPHKSTEVKDPTVLKSSMPKWILSPSQNGKVGAVGSALPHFKGKTAQRRLAISRALDELAQQSGVNVKSTILRKEKRDGAITNSSAEVFSIQNSANKSIKAHIQEIWTNPKTEEIYVWLLAD